MRSAKLLRITCVAVAIACILALYTLVSHFGWMEIWKRPLAILVSISSILILVASIYLCVQPTEKLKNVQHYLFQMGRPN